MHSYDAKVLRAFIRGGRLVSIPAPEKIAGLMTRAGGEYRRAR